MRGVRCEGCVRGVGGVWEGCGNWEGCGRGVGTGRGV